MVTADELKAKYKETYDVDYKAVVLEACQGKVVADVNIGDYQGEEHFLVKKGDQYAHIVTGYGSCSYCDTLQAICDQRDNWEGLAQFVNETSDSIVWKLRDEMIEFVKSHDFKGSWYGSDTFAWEQFKKETLEALHATA